MRTSPASWLLPLLLLACGDKEADSAAAAVTYYADIQPLLAQHCTRCHYDAGLGVGDFTDLDTVRSFAPAMLSAIQDGRMPPPASDPGCHDYVGSDILTLSDEERALFAAWVEAELPTGDPADTPATTPISDQLADPDMIVTMSAPYAPTYSDPSNPGNEYRCFLLEKPSDAAFYIRALAPTIGQNSIAHHAVLFTMKDAAVSEELRRPEGMDCIDSLGTEATEGMIAAWAPGMLPIELPEGAGLYVAPDDQLILQMHYFYSGPDSEGLADQSGYAFRTAQSVEKTVLMAPIGLYSFRIPAGDDSYTDGDTFQNSYVDLEVYGMFPHMHVLGKKFDARIIHEDGSETCLVQGDYDFSNQMTYQFSDPVKFAKGDTISFECTWDNSTGNDDRILDEPQNTYYGERTDEEMCFFFSLVAVD